MHGREWRQRYSCPAGYRPRIVYALGARGRNRSSARQNLQSIRRVPLERAVTQTRTAGGVHQANHDVAVVNLVSDSNRTGGKEVHQLTGIGHAVVVIVVPKNRAL